MQTLSFKQILQAMVFIVVLILLAWIAFYVLIFVLALAAIGACVFYVRRFMVRQGWITPRTPTAPHSDETPHTTIIETEYEVVEEDKIPKN
tara:strand:+ start:802 stop:1074 length:273 start_codon:yes stop_codon:yes gene_type:complete